MRKRCEFFYALRTAERQAPIIKEMASVIELRCSACGELAARVEYSVGDKQSRPTLKRIGYMGEVTIFGDEVELRQFFERIAGGELAGASATEGDFLGFYCRACSLPYCEDCWKVLGLEFEDGFYEHTTAQCPLGHEQIVDD